MTVGDAARLPFPANAYDRVLCYSLIFYFPAHEARRIIEELKRVCKPGGLVMVGDVLDVAHYPGGRFAYALREAFLSALGVTRAFYFERSWFERQGFRLSPSIRTPKRFDAVYPKPK